MTLKPLMILSAGVASGCGKTATAEAVIRLLSKKGKVGACKITVNHGNKGRLREERGGTNEQVITGFKIITDKTIISQPGTDTHRFSASGANPVVWIMTNPEHLAGSWDEVLPLFGDCAAVVIESNSLARFEPGALTLMTLDPTAPQERWKESASELIASADLLIFNQRGDRSELETLRETVRTLRSVNLPAVDVVHPRELTQVFDLEKLLELFANREH